MTSCLVDLDIVNDPRRFIELDAAHNMRDLGGYQLGDGRTIRWGRLYRSDGLSGLSATDLDSFDRMGIRSVIDLRSQLELDERGRYAVDRRPVAFHHLPIIDSTWREDDVPDFDGTESGTVAFLVWAYESMLDQGADRFGSAMSLLAMPGAFPAVFHCAAGKDRTGLLAALILSGLGVSDDIVAADYALTEAAMQAMLAWSAENDPDRLAMMAEAPPAMLAARPAAMMQILSDLRLRYGSITNYLSTLGVGTAVLRDLADQLTDDVIA